MCTYVCQGQPWYHSPGWSRPKTGLYNHTVMNNDPSMHTLLQNLKMHDLASPRQHEPQINTGRRNFPCTLNCYHGFCDRSEGNGLPAWQSLWEELHQNNRCWNLLSDNLSLNKQARSFSIANMKNKNLLGDSKNSEIEIGYRLSVAMLATLFYVCM